MQIAIAWAYFYQNQTTNYTKWVLLHATYLIAESQKAICRKPVELFRGWAVVVEW